MKDLNILNKNTDVIILPNVIEQIEEKLSSNFEDMAMKSKQYYKNFNLTVDWYRSLLKQMSQVNINDIIKKNNIIYIQLDNIGYSEISIYKNKSKCRIYINSIHFKNSGRFSKLFENKQTFISLTDYIKMNLN